ncbi:MAG: signal recognition particle-docking protein FtsY [Actinobacteria bacterium]|nr:signal recognition particle-docking protein FtsY [Actinomycetota bacterium]
MENATLLVVLGAASFLVAAGVLLLLRRRRGRPVPSGVATPAPPVGEVVAPPARGLGARVRALLGGRAPSDEDWRGLEEALIRADVGPAASAELVAGVRERLRPEEDPAELLRAEIVRIAGPPHELRLPAGELGVVMVVGVNGAGKTTTIGKLAHRLAGPGRQVFLANSDTFRAAAAEQLGVWAQRADVHLVAQARGADPGAVAFDAVQAARARGAAVLIVDTAGRLHTRRPLMDELRKVRRVLEKAAGDVEEVLLVLDATTGQNGIAQARAFTEAVDVSGVVLAKMDGAARGGIALAVRRELGIPIAFIGTGESIADLAPFDPERYATRLLDT